MIPSRALEIDKDGFRDILHCIALEQEGYTVSAASLPKLGITLFSTLTDSKQVRSVCHIGGYSAFSTCKSPVEKDCDCLVYRSGSR